MQRRAPVLYAREYLNKRRRHAHYSPSLTFSSCSLSSLLFRIDIAFFVVFSAKSSSI